MYGFANALMFKTITENEIKEVERFIRIDLLEILQANAAALNETLSVDKLKVYFGDFSSMPDQFVFTDEDKIQIHKCVKHVSYKVDLEGVNTDLDHFAISDNIEQHPTEITKVTTDSETKQSHTHWILRKLLAVADQNVVRKKEGYRFDPDLQPMAIALRILCGRYAYEWMHKNMELCFPSTCSADRYIRKKSNNVIEGVIRAKELAEYLKVRNLPPYVCLSEDETGIAGTVQYDSRTNELIGFVLPINEQNGMPIPHSFRARSATEILQHFVDDHAVGSNANVVMAQPLGRVAPFCLLIYASDKKYTGENVADKWDFIKDELQKENVTVLTYSSDSAPAFNSAMKRNSTIGTSSNLFRNRDWFSCGENMDPPFYIQDVVHIATKLRNLFLQTLASNRKLPFGNTYIQIQHLQYLINHFSKGEHLLVASMLNQVDRQFLVCIADV